MSECLDPRCLGRELLLAPHFHYAELDYWGLVDWMVQVYGAEAAVQLQMFP